MPPAAARGLTLGALLALSAVQTACPPPWFWRHEHHEERRERHDDRHDERHDRRDDRDERHDDRRERRD